MRCRRIREGPPSSMSAPHQLELEKPLLIIRTPYSNYASYPTPRYGEEQPALRRSWTQFGSIAGETMTLSLNGEFLMLGANGSH